MYNMILPKYVGQVSQVRLFTISESLAMPMSQL